MAATLVLTNGPANIGEGIKLATYDIALDTAQASGGEAIDLTNEFTYGNFIRTGANDTAADNAYAYSVVAPDSATALTSSNVLVQVHWMDAGATTAKDFAEFTGDASAVGVLQLLVIGK